MRNLAVFGLLQTALRRGMGGDLARAVRWASTPQRPGAGRAWPTTATGKGCRFSCTAAMVLAAAFPAIAMPGSWQRDFAGQGLDGTVYALAYFDGQLIAGGAFCHAGGIAANNIARWDGTRWLPLGEGLTFGSPEDGSTPWVSSLCVHDGALIATGGFTRAGTVDASCVALWDGRAWRRFPGTFNAVVYTAASYAGNLLVGGRFTSIDGRPVRFVALFDGVMWQPMPTGVNAMVSAAVLWDGRLAVGGLFTTADFTPCGGVAVWNGAWWEPLGAGMSCGQPATWVFALTVFRGNLVAGGVFTQADGRPATGIARWDGSAWQPLGGGILSREEPFVFTLACYGERLIVGGSFTHAGGQCVDRIAAWDGQSWSELGGGTNGWIRSLCVIDGSLYAAGHFTLAGGLDSPRIARWITSSVPAHVIDLSVERIGDSRARVRIHSNGGWAASVLHVHRTTLTTGLGETPAGTLLRLTDAPVIVPAGQAIAVEDADAPRAGAAYYLEDLRDEGVVWHGPAILPAVATWEPATVTLSPAAPNPFKGATSIAFTLAESGQVDLSVLDLRGRTVATIVDTALPAGGHRTVWDGHDDSGAAAAQGVYLVRLSVGGRQATRTVAFAGR